MIDIKPKVDKLIDNLVKSAMSHEKQKHLNTIIRHQNTIQQLRQAIKVIEKNYNELLQENKILKRS